MNICTHLHTYTNIIFPNVETRNTLTSLLLKHTLKGCTVSFSGQSSEAVRDYHTVPRAREKEALSSLQRLRCQGKETERFKGAENTITLDTQCVYYMPIKEHNNLLISNSTEKMSRQMFCSTMNVLFKVYLTLCNMKGIEYCWAISSEKIVHKNLPPIMFHSRLFNFYHFDLHFSLFLSLIYIGTQTHLYIYTPK